MPPQNFGDCSLPQGHLAALGTEPSSEERGRFFYGAAPKAKRQWVRSRPKSPHSPMAPWAGDCQWVRQRSAWPKAGRRSTRDHVPRCKSPHGITAWVWAVALRELKINRLRGPPKIQRRRHCKLVSARVGRSHRRYICAKSITATPTRTGIARS